MTDLHAWRPDVGFSHNMSHLDVDRRLIDRWPVVKMLHGYFGTCVSGLKMHAFPSAQACGRTFGPACLALYFPRRCGQLAPGAMMRGYRWASRAACALFPLRGGGRREPAHGRRDGTKRRAARSPERAHALFHDAGRCDRRRRRSRHGALCRTNDAAQGRRRPHPGGRAGHATARPAGPAPHGRRWAAERCLAQPRLVAPCRARADGMGCARRPRARVRQGGAGGRAQSLARALRAGRTRRRRRSAGPRSRSTSAGFATG